MLGIYSLIWTICHKLMCFYRNAVLFCIISSWCMEKSLVIWRYGYFDSKQNGAADRGISGDGVIFLLLLKEIRLQLSHKASQQVLLQYVSLMAETDKVSLVLWSTVSQNLRPHGAARTMWVYFTLCQQSTLKSQNSGCVLYWRCWPNWWWEKIRAGNSQKSGWVLIISEVRVILETRWYTVSMIKTCLEITNARPAII